MKIQHFDYHLPKELVAQIPTSKRSASSLVLSKNQEIVHLPFSELPKLLDKDSHLVFNHTKVIKARIRVAIENKWKVEFFLLNPHNQTFEEALQRQKSVAWVCLIGNKKKLKTVDKVQAIVHGLHCTFQLLSYQENIVKIAWETSENFDQVLQKIGDIPLPPYIKRSTEESDSKRYQTIFGEKLGSVAAPTASLHFDQKLLNTLKESYATSEVNLHVGLGTFKPVSNENIREHEMHAENFELDIRDLQNIIDKKNILAIGTTVLRLLESLYWLGLKNDKSNLTLNQFENESLEDKGNGLERLLEHCLKKNIETIQGKTSLFILPGYQFKVSRQLITNFHMPKSSLLLLVDAFTKGNWRDHYNYAIENRLRFFSYGDANLFSLNR